MKDNYIWIGYFQTEQEFKQYLDQSKYRKYWKENDESNAALSCQFCKEMNIDSYDEDFIVMKYNKDSDDLNALLGIIPAKYEKLKEACERNGIIKANTVIYYSAGEEITLQNAKKAKTVSFIGKYKWAESTVVGGTSLAGLKNMIWIGITPKTKKEFMQYFDQSKYVDALQKFEKGEIKKRPSPDLRCQFCKDLNIKFYYPELLQVKFCDKQKDSKELIKNILNDEFLYDSVFSVIEEKKLTKANVAFIYIPNGYRDAKKNQKIQIFQKRFIGVYKKPQGYMDELEEYNGIKYLGSFMWD